MSAEARGYGGVAKALHWLVFALLLAQYIVAITMPNIGRGTVPGTLINLHMSIGVTILLVIVVRWLWRVDHRVPLATAEMAAWEQRFARVTHALIYLFLVIDPILGWANASARDFTIAVFGIVSLPHIVPAKSAIGMQAGGVHTWLGWALLVLIGLHVAAALFHYFVRRDHVLQRMLPGGAR